MTGRPTPHRYQGRCEIIAHCDALKAQSNDAQTTKIQPADTIVEQAVALAKTGQENGMAVKTETWYDRDKHNIFELFANFNEWLESDDCAGLFEANGNDALSQSSKAFLPVIRKPMPKPEIFKKTAVLQDHEYSPT